MEVSFTLIITVIAIGVLIGILIAYLAWRKLRFNFFNAILLTFFATISIVKFHEGDVAAFLFAWFSSIMAVSLALDVTSLVNKEVNARLMVLVLVVISGGGVVVNALILSSSVDLWLKAFSLAILIAVHIPLLVGMTAYLVGKKSLSKKFIEEFYLKRRLGNDYERSK